MLRNIIPYFPDSVSITTLMRKILLRPDAFSFQKPLGSIRKPSITFGFSSRSETTMLLWSIVGIDPCDICDIHLPLQTNRTLQSLRLSLSLSLFFPLPPSLSLPLSPLPLMVSSVWKFCRRCSFQAAAQKKNRKKERKVVVLFVNDEECSHR